MPAFLSLLLVAAPLFEAAQPAASPAVSEPGPSTSATVMRSAPTTLKDKKSPPEALCRLYERPKPDPTSLATEPRVAIGLMTGRAHVLIKIHGKGNVCFTESGVEHALELEDGTSIDVSLDLRSPVARPPQEVKQSGCMAPWRARLNLVSERKSLGTADSIITFSPHNSATHIEVAEVAYGMGYSWAGTANRRYYGDIVVVVGPKARLDVVNIVAAEDLLAGTVPAELPASAPAQALRAQAVAARNVLVTGLGRRHRGSPYDFCAEQHCQVYGGIAAQDARSSQAVAATRGEVLFFDGKPVRALYSARCGGHTENNEIAWHESPDPALRGRPDTVGPWPALGRRSWQTLVAPGHRTWCSRGLGSRVETPWEQTITHDQLIAFLGQEGRNIAPLTNVWGEGRGPGGRLKKLHIQGEHGQITIKRELPIRQTLGNLRSAAITLATSESDGQLTAVTLHGVGWGHGVGMCQSGAVGRAKAGHGCAEILAHYYNGAQVQPLWTDAVRGCALPSGDEQAMQDEEIIE